MNTRIIAAFFLLGLLSATLRAESALMQGGRSPNGRYEVLIVQSDDDSGYGIQIRSTKTAKPLFTLNAMGAYLTYKAATERCKALWHSSGEFVAIANQGTRHSQEIYLVALDSTAPEQLNIPDYALNALGRVKAVNVGLTCVSSLVKWRDDDLVVKLIFDTEHRTLYHSDVILHLRHGPNSAPSVGLKSVSTPVVEEG